MHHSSQRDNNQNTWNPCKLYVCRGFLYPVLTKAGLIITIARQHGSQGKQIGKLVAEKLGIPFYDKELAALAAQEIGYDKEFISDINKNSPAILRDLYLSTTVIQDAIIAQNKIIKRIAENGSCVIVGRAADYVLSDNENVVKLFLHAPKEYRVQNIMKMYGDSEIDAKKHLHRADEARAAYYENISGQVWGNAENYDFTIDCSNGIEEIATYICEYIDTISSRNKK